MATQSREPTVEEEQERGLLGQIEVHSIDWIPDTERHGKTWQQAMLWFLGNFQYFTIPIGFVGPALGLSLGWSILAGALGIAFVIYRLGHRLNLARFFTVIGVLLMIFAAGLLADSVQNLQELGWLPLLDTPMWHSASVLSEDSAVGDVLHSFFGYSDAPTPLQLLIYIGYLTTVIVVYLGVRARLGARADRPHAAA